MSATGEMNRGKELAASGRQNAILAPMGHVKVAYLSIVSCIVLLLTGCARQPAISPMSTLDGPRSASTATTTPIPVSALPTPEPPATVGAATAMPTEGDETDLTMALDLGPFDIDESHCGVQLPVMAPPAPATEQAINVTAALTSIPDVARPAVEYILSNPEHVALAAYEIGRESEGIYLNADRPVPLASVVKVLHLVAYARAVQLGEIDPAAVVPLADVERYYLPNSDLGAHPRAVATLVEEERVFGSPPSVHLEDVPRMMMEFSSNAATDYLHMLLGQERIEETALALGMSQQTAPCPFLGQFLLMGRRDDGLTPVQTLIEEPSAYSREVMALTEQYSQDSAFRAELRAWQGRDRRPSLEAQQLFSEYLNAHGSAREYANLMAQIALNTLGPWEESVRIRRYMEWPTHFTDNQERLAWLGYKGGSLPGVMTVAYYAQPWDTPQPVVVALFFHNLPTDTYRQWRRTLPHDELARWLLREREATPAIHALLN